MTCLLYPQSRQTSSNVNNKHRNECMPCVEPTAAGNRVSELEWQGRREVQKGGIGGTWSSVHVREGS